MNKKTLEEYLKEVDYSFLNSDNYKPTAFALEIMAYVNLINGTEGEENKSPPMHLASLDKYTKYSRIINLFHRGSGKTTLHFEYMAPILAIKRSLPLVGNLKGMMYISDTMENGVASARKAIEDRCNSSKFIRESIKDIKFRENNISFVNADDELFTVKLYGISSGFRGGKIGTQRPKLAVVDDIISDKSSSSPTTMANVKKVINGGLEYALHPTQNKIVWNGTPFNKQDVILQAIESGAWAVSTFPVCERFPCSPEEFRGSWEDRFPYKTIYDLYTKAKKEGALGEFNKEMMLQVSSEEDRLVQDRDIQWYDRSLVLRTKHAYNFYITTDFATSEKQSADDTVMSVWAVNSNGDYYWVDGICAKQTMDKTIADLLRLCQHYKPQTTGIEVNGQQYGFIPLIKQECLRKNIFFNIAEVRSSVSKLARFNLVLPLFKAGKIYFPEDMQETPTMKTFMSQLKLITNDGIKGHDDCIDTISMLAGITVLLPTYDAISYMSKARNGSTMWGSLDTVNRDTPSAYSSYLV